MTIKPDEIIQYCLENLDGAVNVDSWGEKGIFYNPHKTLKRGVYILTIKLLLIIMVLQTYKKSYKY